MRREPQTFDRVDVVVVSLCVVLAAWVQRHALGAFFSSPDDLVHLQQAVGLKPVLPTPLRFLSQVLYFRLMVGFFGLHPLPFHIATLGAHLVILALLYAVLRSAGVTRHVAALGIAFFGAAPLHLTLLSSAVGMNDELAFLLALVALLLFMREPTRRARAIGASLFVLALLCKESVLFLPLLLLVPAREPWRAALRRAMPLLLVAGVFALVIVAIRPFGLAPGGRVYAMRMGPNLFHNLMTYTSWAMDVRDPIPDLITRYSAGAWRFGLIVLGAFALVYATCRSCRQDLRLGAAWWVLGLLPVLLLESQTYRHYMYPAMPGLALAIATSLAFLAERVASAASLAMAAGRSPARSRAMSAGLAVCALLYAARADALIQARIGKRVEGIDLPFDPVIRRREVARRALASIGQIIGPGVRRIAILMPAGTGRAFGVRSGPRAGRGAAMPTYNLLEESLDKGAAVRLFFPQVDTTVFLSRWTPEHRDHHLFLSYREGSLAGFGTGRTALARAADWMFQQEMFPQAREFLDSALTIYPADARLRLACGFAHFRLGERTRGREQLEEVLRLAPEGEVATAARAMLAAEGEREN